MNEREVLEMLKSKIDAAAKVGCNYAIETEDEDAINKALNTPAVVFSEAEVCQIKQKEYERGIEDGKIIAEHGTVNWQT